MAFKKYAVTSLIFISVVLLLVLGRYFYASGTAANNGKAQISAVAPSSIAITSTGISPPNASPLRSGKQPLTDEKKRELLAALAQYKIWMNQRGYFNSRDLEEYSGYGDSALFALVKTGDLRAITVRGDREYENKRYKEAKLIYTDGAIRGSVDSLQRLSQISYDLYIQASKANNLDAANQYAVDVAAWDKIAKERGASVLYDAPTTFVLSSLKNEDGAKSIEAAAQFHYQQLEQQRQRMGLGNFDNTITPAFAVIKSIDESYYDPSVGPNDPRKPSELYF